MKDPELETYCDRVESFFFRCKGRPGVLSPDDFGLVKAWFHQGTPIEAVLEGIADAFDSQRSSRNADIEEVNSLSFCMPFIDRAVQRSGHF